MFKYSNWETKDLRYIIAALTNAWLTAKMPEHKYDKEKVPEEIERFLNLPLRMVYGLARQGFLLHPHENDISYTDFIQLDGHMHGVEVSLAEASSLAERHQLTTVEIISEKTHIQPWVKQLVSEKAISGRLKKILNAENFPCRYLEDVTKKRFLKVVGSGQGTWKEFVKLRGWE
jgi:hypothetical protein